MTFYKGECVRSRFDGLGEVIVTGENPVVQFLDGPEMRVPGDMLTVVPRGVFETEVENRRRIERYLDCRLHGVLEPDICPLPPPPFDLEAAMTSTRFPFDARCSHPVGRAGLCFVLDDLSVSDGGHPPLPVDPRPIRVAARRVRDRNCHAGWPTPACGCPFP